MSEVRLVVRDAQRSIYADRHGGFAESVIAALSAGPETIEELDRALDRFIAPDEWSNFRGFHEGCDDRPYDAGLVVVDLAAALLVCDSTYCSASHEGAVSYHNGKAATEVWVQYHLPAEWKIVYHTEDWQAMADQRRETRAANPPLDARAVLYGEPLLAFIARECFEAFRGSGEPPIVDHYDAAYQREYELMRQIHMRWMMTPREDLRGQTPRQTMNAGRKFVDQGVHDRRAQWDDMDRCPPGIDEDSVAYRLAGFGSHEHVVYYDMVRHLLWCGRLAVAGQAATTVDAFAASQLKSLAQMREHWLDEPYSETTGASARSIVAKERSGLPEGLTGAQAIIDDDCPLCQMQAELPGTTFWHLDGCNMDNDFAFAFHHETLAEWEQEQREYEEWDRRWEARKAEEKRLGVDSESQSIWQSRFSCSERGSGSLTMRLFTIGSCLCELIVDLRQPKEQRDLIDGLGRAFGNLREVVHGGDLTTAGALVEPVLNRLCDELHAVEARWPKLAQKCADLRGRFEHFLDLPPEPNGDVVEDDDLPF